jgi:glyoxylase-like metal-dependent hydrolase (beta-lactamase superfamily II)
MRVTQVTGGLWRWTGLHPEWTPDADWEEEVGCVYYEAPGAIVLIDPLVPPEDPDRFLGALERDLDQGGRPLAILLTLSFHARSAGELVELYGASVGALPLEGVAPFAITGVGGEAETLYWLEGPRALVAGDVLLGDPLRVCPDAWLPEELQGEPIREALRPLLDLPVERVLTAHGEPLLENGRAALEDALR